MKTTLLLASALLATAAPTLPAAEALNPKNPDRNLQTGVPEGKIVSGIFAESQIFPGTKRDYSVYVPAQYSPEKPAALMVFMDGGGYAKKDGAFRVPVVFDNGTDLVIAAAPADLPPEAYRPSLEQVALNLKSSGNIGDIQCRRKPMKRLPCPLLHNF